MDLLSMLMNARISDIDGDDIGEVFGVHIAMGKLSITVDTGLDSRDEEDDPDGGEEIDGDEDEEDLDSTEEVPKPMPLRAVAGGKR